MFLSGISRQKSLEILEHFSKQNLANHVRNEFILKEYFINANCKIFNPLAVGICFLHYLNYVKDVV